jgi:hypothetical protein
MKMINEDEKTLLSSTSDADDEGLNIIKLMDDYQNEIFLDPDFEYNNSRKKVKKRVYIKVEITPLRFVLFIVSLFLLAIYLFWPSECKSALF